MLKKFIYLLSIALFAVAMESCSDDNELVINQDDVEDTVVDELAYLQKNLAIVSEDGSLKERIHGVVLDPGTPNTVYIGVENYDEAREIFSTLFSDTTRISDDGTRALFTTRQGSAELEAESGSEGLLACAIFNVDGLKYVDKINFIANSAWPENAQGKGFHKLGVQYMYKAWTGGRAMSGDDKFDADEMHTFVCVREYNNGVPALLVGISTQSLYIMWRGHNKYGGNMPGENRAQEIAKIISANWDFYESAFNANSKDLLAKDREYWIDSGHEKIFNQTRGTIKLNNGKIKQLGVHWHEPKCHALFFLLSTEKL